MKVFRIILFVVACLNSVAVFAQPGYRITYTYDPFIKLPTFNGQSSKPDVVRERLVFRDSLSISYRMMNNFDAGKKKLAYGTKLVHHGTLYNSASKIRYQINAWPVGKKNEYLMWDTLAAEEWIFPNESKKIHGYVCKPAMSISLNGDTTLVWFTPQIDVAFGPGSYYGFPGLVMEVTDQRYQWHLVATKIEKDDFTVTMPVDVKILSLAEVIASQKGKGPVQSQATFYKTIRQKSGTSEREVIRHLP